MDPNAARSKMIEKANLVLAMDNGDASFDGREAVELAEAVHDLDEWLRSGGFLPTEWAVPRRDRGEWQPGRQQDVDIAVPEPKPEGFGKEKDDERPRIDGGVCGHPLWVTARDAHRQTTIEMSCVLDRGHEGDHTPPDLS